MTPQRGELPGIAATVWRPERSQSGVALVVGLILLTALTVIGASAMSTATLDLIMSSNAQFLDQAFQAAETGIDLAIAEGTFDVESPTAVVHTGWNDGAASAEVSIGYSECTPVPGTAFSLAGGAGRLQAFHFEIIAVGMGPRNAVSTHAQGLYILGPGSQPAP